MSSGSKKDFTNTLIKDLGEFSFETAGDRGLEFLIKDNIIENISWRYQVRVFNDKRSEEMEMKVPWFTQ